LGITLIAVALTESGLFPTADPIVMIMLGAHAGNSLNIYLHGWRFAGSSRQVIMGQVLTNAVGVILFLGIFSLWRPAQIPQALGGWWPADIGQQAVSLTILLNVAMPALFSLFAARSCRLLERSWPPLERESFVHPAYIQTYMGGEPETAVLLAEKEQLRLLKRLPAYLDELRIDRERKGEPGPEVYHAAFVPLSEQILEFLLTVMQRDVVLETSEQLLHLQNRQRLLAIIEEDVFGLFQILKGRRGEGKAGQLGLSIIESLDTLLLTVIAAAETGDAHEQELLSLITADRGSLMEQIRKNYLSLEQNSSAEDRSLVLYLTHLFERTVWSIGQYGRLLGRTTVSPSSRHLPEPA
jgi:phosphate:Na+ symporter